MTGEPACHTIMNTADGMIAMGYFRTEIIEIDGEHRSRIVCERCGEEVGVLGQRPAALMLAGYLEGEEIAARAEAIGRIIDPTGELRRKAGRLVRRWFDDIE